MTHRIKMTIQLLIPEGKHETGEDLFWKNTLGFDTSTPTDLEIEDFCNTKRNLGKEIFYADITDEENAARISALQNLQIVNYDQENNTVEVVLEFPSEEIYTSISEYFNPMTNLERVNVNVTVWNSET